MSLIPELAIKLNFLAGGRKTRRYHAGLSMHDYQRVDAHSYGVLMLTRIIVPNANAERRARLMEAAAEHDLAEQYTGDMPSPAKRKMDIRDKFKEYEDKLMADHGFGVKLNSADERVLKLADNAEGCLHCIEERMMGNKNIVPIFHAFWSYLTGETKLADVPQPEEGEQTLRSWIAEKWNIANEGEW